MGFLSLAWFVVRVIPKPTRAAYPCMRVAAPFASSFVTWLLGMGGLLAALRKGFKRVREARYTVAAGCGVLAVLAASVAVFGTRTPMAWVRSVVDPVAPDPVNAPIGVARGYNPGRVAWVHDPDATDWAGEGSGYWWDPAHTDQSVVDSMMSRAVRWLAGKPTESEAWLALFRHFNHESGRGLRGYESGERITIKVNLTTCNPLEGAVNPDTGEKSGWLLSKVDTAPQMILALLRQLVNVVGMEQTDISVGDTVTYFPNQWYDYLAGEFPNVQYLDHFGDLPGRTGVAHSDVRLYWSTDEADGKLQDYVPVSYAEADYIINFAVLKGHAAGITVCGKNHYGSMIRTPSGWEWGEWKSYYDLHNSLPWHLGRPGRGYYRTMVDLMGHEDVGGKAFLCLVDALYGGYYWEGTPYKWGMPPFGTDWPSSLFASQDPVAIDSVAYDFLVEEWPDVVSDGAGDPDSLQGGAQDYLHEAALADSPPSETTYDPESDGSPLQSQGVHEHWNDSVNKQYSRNLGTGDGVELISEEPGVTLDLAVRSTPGTGVPIDAEPEGCGGVTDYMVHPEGDTEVTLTAPASWDDGNAVYRFVRWTLDGTEQLGGERELAFTFDADAEAVAVYSDRPFDYVWGTAYHILPETHNMESGYFSLCEGLDGRMYVGTAKYQVNAYLVEFDPATEQQQTVIDVHDLCGLTDEGYAAQAKIHTRNDVGQSGKIYVGSKQGYREEGDESEYPGGYVMTYDPASEQGENLGMPYPAEGVIDTVADESRGLIYVVTCEEQHWMLYETATPAYTELGPLLTPYATTLIDGWGRANALTEDFQLAQYDPDRRQMTIRDIMVDGELFVREGPYSIPTWRLAADGRTAYLILLNDLDLIEIDLLSAGDTVDATNRGTMLAGSNPDSRCSLDIGSDGKVYVVARVDNDTGFGTGYLHHLTEFDPATGGITDHGVLAVKNPDFFDFGPPPPPWSHGYHTLPDGVLTPLHHHMALVAASDGTIYITILYPFTLLRISDFFTAGHTLSVKSEPVADVVITAEPESAGGVTDYAVQLAHGMGVTLTAPLQRGSRPFLRWEDGEGAVLTQETAVDLTMDADKTVVAVYSPVPIAHGVVSAGHRWRTVNFAQAFESRPVVVAGPATCKDRDPGAVRVRKVTKGSFQIRFEEWPYLDGKHTNEKIAWVAVARGTWDLGDGKTLIAGVASVGKRKVVGFPHAFDATPIVLAQVQTTRGAGAVTDRIGRVRTNKFRVGLQEQEAAGRHPRETVGYIAVSAGVTGVDEVSCDTGRTPRKVTHKPYQLATAKGTCKVRVEEEKSKDRETRHKRESVGYVAFGGATPILIADMQTCTERDTAALRYKKTLARLPRVCQLGISTQEEHGNSVPGARPGAMGGRWSAPRFCALIAPSFGLYSIVAVLADRTCAGRGEPGVTQ